MMSEEEKKAIDELKQLKKDFEIVDKIVKDRDKQETKTIDAILNLIEKQQNNIQALKKQIKQMQEYYKNADFIFKDKIKEKIEELQPHSSFGYDVAFKSFAITILEELFEEV